MSALWRVGIIGCGGIVKNHVRGYLHTGRFKVVALADVAPEAMADYEREFTLGATHYADAREMLDREDLDVVSIGTWHAGHAPWTIAAAARRPKAILCEKPMADSLGAAEAMLVACQRNDVKLVIGHQRRFLPTYGLARDLIADGAVGDVQLMQSFGGDGLPNRCSHQADMFRYILSDDECLWAMGNIERKTDRWERNTPIEDCAVAIYGFACGARGVILSQVTPMAYHGARVYGSKGMIDFTTLELRLLNGDTQGRWELRRPDGRFARLDDDLVAFEWVEGGAGQADELADWIVGSVDTHRGRGENGFKALEMIHAIYESARRHEKVELPLQTRVSPLELMIASGHLAVERPGRFDIRAAHLRGERMERDDEVDG